MNKRSLIVFCLLLIGGGCVWAQFDWHLYKAPLTASH